ncbi:MAG TPA: glycosyltransferase [Acidimicrobiales bacterium]|nr:glycosyltransferase [Acidimicrobiales bacterium]
MARILTLTNWYPPHHFGGYEVLCDDVTTRLHRRGHQVEVLCGAELLPEVPEGPSPPYPVHRRLRMYWRDGLPWTPEVGEQLAIERANQRQLEEVLDRYRPDVVSVWHMGALSLNLLTTVRRRGIPMVYAICDEWLIYGLELDPWSHRWFTNPLRRAAGRVAGPLLGVPTVLPDLGAEGCFCFLSRHTRRSTEAASPWSYPIDPIVYPGIERSMFPPPDPAEPPPWGWNLLYTSRLDARKGVDTLLRALTLLPEAATLSLLGRGEPAERARLEALATELGLAERVRFEPLARADLAQAYRSHDCFIFPSEWPEPFGMVPLEAMACGTPVVATGVGGSGEFLLNGVNCLLFPPGDAPALAEAITRLATDRALCRALRAQGWVAADQFDVEWTADAYEACHLAAAEHRLGALELPPHPFIAARPDHALEIQPKQAFAEVGASLVQLERPLLSLRGGGDGPLAGPGPERDSTFGVTEDTKELPYADGAFAAIACQGALERVADDRALVAELARVCRPGGTVAFVSANRRNATIARARLVNFWRGWHRSAAQYGGAEGQLRQYSWPELEALLSPHFRIVSRLPIGWGQGAKQRTTAAALRGPLRSVSRAMVIAATPR